MFLVRESSESPVFLIFDRYYYMQVSSALKRDSIFWLVGFKLWEHHLCILNPPVEFIMSKQLRETSFRWHNLSNTAKHVVLV